MDVNGLILELADAVNYDVIIAKLADINGHLDKVFQFSFLTSEAKCLATQKAVIILKLTDVASRTVHGVPWRVIALSTLRVLSREKLESACWITTDLMDVVKQISQYAAASVDRISSATYPEVLETVKCLCNLCFNSEFARQSVDDIFEPILRRIRDSCCLQFPMDIRIFDMRLCFILTAIRKDLAHLAITTLNGLEVCVFVLETVSRADLIDTKAVDLLVECLKTTFNLAAVSQRGTGANDSEVELYRPLYSVCCALLAVTDINCSNRSDDIHTHVVNLLTAFSGDFGQLSVVTMPEQLAKEKGIPWYNGYDMRTIECLLKFMDKRLDASLSEQTDSLLPIVTVFISLVQNSPLLRKYVRFKVLPPLRDDVMRRPEEGSTLRNKLCRLMTSASVNVKSAVAMFLFELCQRSVGRLIKYTGFGNAAGLLADFGLFGQLNSVNNGCVDDESSDTEEYLRVKDQINPVLGCYEKPHPNPFEGMSEEQKEYEAMRLVNALDQLTRSGAVRPARVNEKGQLEPVEHVLQMQEDNLRSLRGKKSDDEDSE